MNGRLMMVTLDLSKLNPGGPAVEYFSAKVGVDAILKVAVASDFALRRVRRRPVSLAEEFYKMVEA